MKFKKKLIQKIKKHYLISSVLFGGAILGTALLGLNLSTVTYANQSVNNQNIKPRTVRVNQHKPRKANNKNKYRNKRKNGLQQQVSGLPLERVTKNTVAYNKHKQSFTSGLKIRKNSLVKPKQILMSNHTPYVRIMSQGRNLGWIKASNLKQTNYYKLPYQYISQFWPSKAKDACEIASLKTAMSNDNKAMNIPLSVIVSRIPLSKNPNQGYTGNPYRYGTHASIYPVAMVNVAAQYGVKSKDISNAPLSKFIYYVTHGNPVVYEGPFMMKRPGSDHDLTIEGYKPCYFYVVDPFAAYRNSRLGTWVSLTRFKQLYMSKQREQKAMVIYCNQ